MNTVHIEDAAGAMWASANWMAPLGRQQANKLAGEDIHSNDKNKVKDVAGVPDPSQRLIAPLFNLVRRLF